MSDTAQLAARIAAGLASTDRYIKCVRRGSYSPLDGLGEPSQYALDTEGIARDAWAIALKIEDAERDRNRNAR